MNPTILALDASSTNLGFCFYDGAVLASGEIALKHADIAERCRLAFTQLGELLALYGLPDVVALEAPASPHKGALIPQCRVSGALMVAASLAGLLIVEVAPQHAKQALTGKGNASKDMMQAFAWERYGVRGEHAADAVGVALSASKMVTVERLKGVPRAAGAGADGGRARRGDRAVLGSPRSWAARGD